MSAISLCSSCRVDAGRRGERTRELVRVADAGDVRHAGLATGHLEDRRNGLRWHGGGRGWLVSSCRGRINCLFLTSQAGSHMGLRYHVWIGVSGGISHDNDVFTEMGKMFLFVLAQSEIDQAVDLKKVLGRNRPKHRHAGFDSRVLLLGVEYKRVFKSLPCGQKLCCQKLSLLESSREGALGRVRRVNLLTPPAMLLT